MNSYAEGYPSKHSRCGKLSSGSFLDSSTFDEVCFISAMSSIKDYYKFDPDTYKTTSENLPTKILTFRGVPDDYQSFS